MRSLAVPEGQEDAEASFGVGSEASWLSPNCRGGCRRERPGRGSWLGGELYDAEGGQGARFGQQGVACGGWRPHYAAGSSGGCGSSGLRRSSGDRAGRGAHAHRFGARGHLPMSARRESARGLEAVGDGFGRPVPRQDDRDLEAVTPAQALAHPTWNMGAKISIDSSTLMNKGLEVIEAHHLFAMPYDQIEVVVQPQSAIHSMVEFIDGSVLAHLARPICVFPFNLLSPIPSGGRLP